MYNYALCKLSTIFYWYLWSKQASLPGDDSSNNFECTLRETAATKGLLFAKIDFHLSFPHIDGILVDDQQQLFKTFSSI